MPSRKPFRIGRSRTGLGLFATKSFRKGQTVVEYSGRHISSQEADRLEDEGRNSYLFAITKKWTIDGSSRKNYGRYVNHSCRPNAEAIMRHTGRLEYAAMRRIEPGEEVTVDYGKEYYRIFLQERGCLCAACAKRAQVKRSGIKRSKRKASKKRGKRDKRK